MPWQPIPAAAIEPSGTTVERLCGQPEQKYGWRTSVSGAGRSRSASSSATRAVIESRCSFRSRRGGTSWANRSAARSPFAGARDPPPLACLPPASRHDPQPGLRRGDGDTIDPVGGGEGPGRFEASVVDEPLRLEPEGRHQHRLLLGLPGPPLEQEAGVRDDDPMRRDLGRPHLVGDVGHDLETDPQPRVARQLEAETAEIENFLNVPREKNWK